MPEPRTPLDRARFAALWARLGAGGAPDPVFLAIAAAHGEPHRVYHGAAHLLACLAELDRARGSARRPDEAEAALWFHDAVYDPRAADNERRSAEWAGRALVAAGAAAEVAARVADLVLATRHLAPTPMAEADPDACLVADVDLAVLGATADEFDRYDQAIRAEYGWVPEAVYRRERARVLETFLGREPLYRTPSFRDRYEARAKANLRRALERLGSPAVPGYPPSRPRLGAPGRYSSRVEEFVANQATTELVDGLNQDLRGEFQAVIMYRLYASMVQGPYRQELRTFFSNEIPEELTHAQILADKISALGGTPAAEPSPVAVVMDAKEMLESALKAEVETIGRYVQRREQAEKAGEFGLAAQFDDIIADETHHRDELQQMLARWP